MCSSDQDKCLIREFTPTNLLSFGPSTDPLKLTSLNVLIGPNGSGKSNFLEAISLLRSTPADVASVVRRGGGVSDWIWKGDPKGAASVEAIVPYPQNNQPLRHRIAFRAVSQAFALDDERVENEHPNEGQASPYFYYRYQDGHPALNVWGKERRLARESVVPDLSILAQRKDPESYPEISYLVDAYGGIRLYREWSLGRNAVFRQPQQADMRSNRLEEDFSNLGLFLNRLRRTPKAKKAILGALRGLYEGVDDFDVAVEGGAVQVFFTEGDFTIPATRLSDGTLRYLCLIAMLCDPTPPPLICIEEPELGLHPDVLPQLAELLFAASSRTQLVVTTHSDVLVDAMTDRPEAVVVCEKHDGRTTMRRLESGRLEAWLGKYRLGQLWTEGQIGGNRW